MIFTRLLNLEICALFVVFPILGGGYGDSNNFALHFSVLLILATWLMAAYCGRIMFEKATAVLIPFVFFALALFISNIYSISPRESWLETLLYMDGFVLLLVTATSPRTGKEMRKVFFFCGAASAALSVYALFNVVVSFPDIPAHPLARLLHVGKPQRAFATFIHPNVFGSYLVIACLFILACLQTSKSRTERIFPMLFLVLNGLALFFTFSFGAGIFFGVVLALTVLFSKDRLFLMKYIALAACIVIAASLLVVHHYTGDASSSIKQDVILLTNTRTKKTSFAGRVSMWKTAAHVSSHYPVSGNGLRTFKFIGPQHQRDPVYSVYPHHMILQMFSEAGLFGVFGLLWVLAYLLIKMSRIVLSLKEHDDYPFAVSVFLCIVYVILHGLIDFEWNIPLFPLVVFSFSGMFICPQSPSETSLHPRGPVFFSRSIKKLLPVLCIVIIAFSLKTLHFFLAYHRFERARFLIIGREYTQAHRILERDGKFLEHDGKYHSAMAKIYESSGDFGKASLHNQKAVRLEPYSVSYLGQGARIDQRTGLLENAREKLVRALKLCPFCVDYRYALALIAMQKNKTQEAKTILLDIDERLPAYERAQKVPQIYLMVFLSLGDLYDREGDKSRALLFYGKALKHFPGNPEILKRLSKKT